MAYNRLSKRAQMMPPADPMAGGATPPADPSMMGGDPSMMGPDPAMGGDPSMGADPSMGGAPQQFTLASLVDFIESDPDTAMETLKQKVSNGDIQTANGPTEAWSLFEPENWRSADDKTKGQVAGHIMELLPPEMKANENMGTEDQNVIPAVKETVKASCEAIKQLAVRLATSMKAKTTQKKAFNLSAMRKEAAGLAVETYPLINPNDQRTVIDPRREQLITTRDVIERNRSWGIRPSDVFSRMGIDYDTLWQTYLMDKFYPEQRDADGNWVGGYIQNRFEVDKNIPEFNNMQYKPGQRSKPERATLTEGLLEQARGAKKAFNLRAIKTASGRKSCTACGCAIANIDGDKCPVCMKDDAPKKKVTEASTKVAYEQQKGPLDGPDLGMTSTCQQCGGTTKAHGGKCHLCGAQLHGGVNIVPNRPLQRGEKPVGYNPLQQVAPANQPINMMQGNPPRPPKKRKLASIPDASDEGALGYGCCEEEEQEFKQVVDPASMGAAHADPHAKLKALIRRHDNVRRSFDALFGGPETDYANGIL